jgi:hypothetical protein
MKPRGPIVGIRSDDQATQRSDMRRPFFMDDLSPEERRATRRMLFGILFGYTAIILLVFAVVVVRHEWCDRDVDSKPCATVGVTSAAVSHARDGDCDRETRTNASVLRGRRMES